MNLPNFMKAQSVADSVEMKAGYAYDVYYSLKNGIVDTFYRSNWDIAFGIGRRTGSILINEGKGIELYLYKGGDINDWETADTVGIKTWPKLFNADSSWEWGAFNQNVAPGDDFDQGWGIYNMISHNVEGDSIYFIKLGAADYRKIIIVEENGFTNDYTIKFSNVDGSNEHQDVAYSDGLSRNFIYYSLNTKDTIDREPVKSSWDLLFTKYAELTQGNYIVTGALQNIGCQVAEYHQQGLDQETYNEFSSLEFQSNISEIGYDWKFYDMGQGKWTISDTSVYFVKNLAGDIYKLYFTGFSGSSTGKAYFKKELIEPASVHKIQANLNFSIYPIPAADQITFLYTGSNEKQSLMISDISGKQIASYNLNHSNGTLLTQQIDLSKLNPGLYFASICNGTYSITKKFIKTK